MEFRTDSIILGVLLTALVVFSQLISIVEGLWKMVFAFLTAGIALLIFLSYGHLPDTYMNHLIEKRDENKKKEEKNG